MKTAASLLLVVLCCGLVQAQTVPPALMVKGKEKSDPLHLAKVDTQVRIFGPLAQTSTTMTFTNPSDRVLEGDLYFPLPEGATVSGYALDIEGRMVDGVAVEKEKGREVFEKIVRQGLDPGLVEWTKGSNFKTRVFPIPAHGSRTIRIDYASELIGGEPAYHLPLRYREKVEQFTLRVEVVKPVAPPKVRQGELAGFGFEKWRESYVAETTVQGATLTEDLVVALPEVQKQNVLVEKAEDGQTYFCIQDFPKGPEAGVQALPPRHVVLYWDASGSRGAGDHKRELRLLETYFKQWAGRASPQPPKAVVDLVLVRNAASPPKRLELAGYDPAPLITELEKVQYDGGTQLGAITLPPDAETDTERPDFYLLFSDGLSNFGRHEPQGLRAPLFAFSADAAADHAFLRHLAAANGGQYFNLLRWKDQDVAAAVGRPAWSFLAARVEGGQAAGLYPSAAEAVAGRFLLAGKLAGPEATVSLGYGYPGLTPEERSFKVSAADAARGSLLRRVWAQKKLAELVIDPKRHEKEIVALGKEFGLVTPFTSLIVLERLEQYVEHEIAPPRSLPEMREEYLKRVDTIEHQRQKQRADKLEAVAALWQERVKWWQTQYKYPKDFRYREEDEKKDGRPLRDAPAPGSAAPGSPAPRTEGAHAKEKAPAEEPSRKPAPDGGQGGERRNADKKNDSGPAERNEPAIAIQNWDPKTPYMIELKAAGREEAFAVYMRNRAGHAASPAFFLDCADYFAAAKQPELSLQVLSNIAELELENPALLRVLGHRLAQTGRLDLAVLTFEEVLRLRPEEPQSYRDLALVLARRADQGARAGSSPAVRDDYARAVDLLRQVVIRRWDDRFTEIEMIALEELNAVLPRARAAGAKEADLDRRLIQPLDVDVRIVMTWHADNTDIDLWMIEPSGEKAYYGHNRTTIGGLVSRDFTGGYGPEEYMIRRAMHGTYKVQCNYFGSRAVDLLGPVTVQVDVFTNFGRENQQHKAITVRLAEKQETVTIGQIEF